MGFPLIFPLAVALLYLNVTFKDCTSVGVATFSFVSAMFKGKLLLEKMLESVEVVTAARFQCT